MDLKAQCPHRKRALFVTRLYPAKGETQCLVKLYRPTALLRRAANSKAHELHAASRATTDRIEAALQYAQALEMRRWRCRHSSNCSRCFEAGLLEVA